MKKSILIITILLTAILTHARPVKLWQPEELYDKSDVVIIAKVDSIQKTGKTSGLAFGGNNTVLNLFENKAQLQLIQVIKGKSGHSCILTYNKVDWRSSAAVINGPTKINLKKGKVYLFYLKKTSTKNCFLAIFDGKLDEDQAVKRSYFIEQAQQVKVDKKVHDFAKKNKPKYLSQNIASITNMTVLLKGQLKGVKLYRVKSKNSSAGLKGPDFFSWSIIEDNGKLYSTHKAMLGCIKNRIKINDASDALKYVNLYNTLSGNEIIYSPKDFIKKKNISEEHLNNYIKNRSKVKVPEWGVKITNNAKEWTIDFTTISIYNDNFTISRIRFEIDKSGNCKWKNIYNIFQVFYQ